MTEDDATAELADGVALLDRATSYTMGSLRLVTPPALTRPTPCSQWDLLALLAHMNESLAILEEAVDLGHIAVDAAGPVAAHCDPAADVVDGVRRRAGRLLGAWAGTARGVVRVGGYPVPTGVVIRVAALEILTHGWDVARACGDDRPIPAELAVEMLGLARLFVTDADRPTPFAAPVAVPPDAAPGDKLVAFLGRSPNWTPA